MSTYVKTISVHFHSVLTRPEENLIIINVFRRAAVSQQLSPYF